MNKDVGLLNEQDQKSFVVVVVVVVLSCEPFIVTPL